MKRDVLTFIGWILCITAIASTYSTSDYTVEVPENFEEIGTAAFHADYEQHGLGFNIQMTAFDKRISYPYNEKTLNEIVEATSRSLEDEAINMLKERLRTTYENVSDEQIEEYISHYRCNFVDTKEITRCTKNNYKCFHILSNIVVEDTIYCNQYLIFSNNKMYTITLSAENKEYFESSELKEIIDSFTIKNYEEPQSMLHQTFRKAIIGGIIGAIYGIFLALRKKKRKEKEKI